MTRTHKSLKTVCVKLFGKIGSTLVADLAYVIVITSNQVLKTCETILLESLNFTNSKWQVTEVYSELGQTSKMDCFTKVVNRF